MRERTGSAVLVKRAAPKAAEALPRTSTAVAVAERLRRRIVSGSLSPGQRLTEVEVSEMLGVSRSPVREALIALSREGLVTNLPYRGAIVSMLDEERFSELQSFRAALEVFAVQTLIDVTEERDLKRLDAAVERLRKAAVAKNVAAVISADVNVHETIVSLARNTFLSRSYAELLNESRLYIGVTHRHYDDLDDLVKEHEQLVEAIRNRDREEATRIIRSHIEHGFDAALRDLRGGSNER